MADTQASPLNADPSAEYTLITGSEELARLCRRWAGMEFITLDTEFVRVSSFYPRAGLFQVGDGDHNYLLDPLTIDDWSPFRTLLQDPGTVKVLHSCSEDLLVFLVFFDVLVRPVFDTQLAHAFLGGGFALSYQNLVQHMIGIDLPKGETRSDWLQRPLSDRQLLYAALDVEYLPEIYRRQRDQLEDRDRLGWLREECERLLKQYESERSSDFSDAFLNVKTAWQLDRRQLAALKMLAEWREKRARKRDKPRNWIVDDRRLMTIAKRMPASRKELAAIDGINPNFIRHEGETVLSLLDRARLLADEDLPRTRPQPLGGREKTLIKEAQKLVESRAGEYSLPVELLASRRHLVALYLEVRSARAAESAAAPDEENIRVPPELTGWRRPLLLSGLLEIFRGSD